MKTEKKFLYPDYSYRKDQAEMMDLIYNYLNSEVSLEKLAIEVHRDRKVFRYLFPAALLQQKKSNSHCVHIRLYYKISYSMRASQ